MSLQIKSLSNSAPSPDTALAASNDNLGVIPGANTIYDLYTAANDSSNMKSAIAKSIRLTNTHATSAVAVTLYFNRPTASGQYRRRFLAPPDIVLPPGFTFIDDSEVTLEPGDRIQAKASVANVIQFVISGVERDVF